MPRHRFACEVSGGWAIRRHLNSDQHRYDDAQQGRLYMSDASKGVVLGFFENFSAGNFDAALGQMTDDATWWVAGKFEEYLDTIHAKEILVG